MTPDDAFFRDIIENPDDDTPRLVYADWLDDHGQPDRAAFVRVQIDLARLPENARQRTELEARERVLLAKHGEEWGLRPRWSHAKSAPRTRGPQVTGRLR